MSNAKWVAGAICRECAQKWGHYYVSSICPDCGGRVRKYEAVKIEKLGRWWNPLSWWTYKVVDD